MSQEEILSHLKEQSGSWLTARDISANLNMSLISVRMSLKRLAQANHIDAQKSTMRGNPYEYIAMTGSKKKVYKNY
ncbi:hypothetical protein HZB02_01780 [Candidatus Woesearchaeota archaeon]|nr:hypothetical protein [Candidatus Woesearchaeota archaeon]